MTEKSPRLQISKSSPFGRKVLMAIRHLDLQNALEIEFLDTSDSEQQKKICNPLGKVPALVFETGNILIDSRNIMAYLDHIKGNNTLFPDTIKLWEMNTLHAISDGILEASLLLLYEKRYRNEKDYSTVWIDRQRRKVEKALEYCEQSIDLDIKATADQFALAAALGYLDFRFDGIWRKKHALLVTWLDCFEKAVPAFKQTAPQ